MTDKKDQNTNADRRLLLAAYKFGLELEEFKACTESVWTTDPNDEDAWQPLVTVRERLLSRIVDLGQVEDAAMTTAEELMTLVRQAYEDLRQVWDSKARRKRYLKVESHIHGFEPGEDFRARQKLLRLYPLDTSIWEEVAACAMKLIDQHPLDVQACFTLAALISGELYSGHYKSIMTRRPGVLTRDPEVMEAELTVHFNRELQRFLAKASVHVDAWRNASVDLEGLNKWDANERLRSFRDDLHQWLVEGPPTTEDRGSVGTPNPPLLKQLSVKQVADFVGVSTSTIRRAAEAADPQVAKRRHHSHAYTPNELHRVAKARSKSREFTDKERMRWNHLLRSLDQPDLDHPAKAVRRSS